MKREAKLSTKFLPLQALAYMAHNPHTGGTDPQHGVTFQVDEETREITYEHGTLCKLPDGFDAVLVDTCDPLDIFKWYIGKPKDVAELRETVKAFQEAHERLVELLGTAGVP